MQQLSRIQSLIDAASTRLGGQTRLAEALGKSPQVLSNWRTGVKTPSIETQVLLAVHAGEDVAYTALASLQEGAADKRVKTLLGWKLDTLVAADPKAAATAALARAAEQADTPADIKGRIAMRATLRARAKKALEDARNS